MALSTLPPPQKSQASCFVSGLTEKEIKLHLATLSEAEVYELRYHWPFWARPNQLAPPGNWRFWLTLAGRGWGKSRTGAEWIRDLVESGRARRVALVARTAGDVRDVVVEGEAGILAISRPDFMPSYEPSKRRLTWPNGAIATTFTADKPDELRGPAHDAAWCDEMAAWRYPVAFDMLKLGLRLGDDPRCIITTTPRPTKHIKAQIKDADTIVTRGTTFENRANLAPAFYQRIIAQYKGTRLGRQELYAEILDDNPNALWLRSDIESHRVTEMPALTIINPAIDPATTANEESNETGIVTVGIGTDGHFYVLADDSLRASPDTWGRAAIAAYHRHKADRIIYESNQGGDMIPQVLKNIDGGAGVPTKGVHASRGKRTRAEPIAALYEQGRVHHVGIFPELEDQLCEWEPGMDSPDRLDALVWAITALSTRGPVGTIDRRQLGF